MTIAATTVTGTIATEVSLDHVEGSNLPYAKFAIPVKQHGQSKDQAATIWYNIVVWGEQAVNAAHYLKKGSVVTVTGDLRPRAYKSNDGELKVDVTVSTNKVTYLSNWGADKNESTNLAPSLDDIPF